MTITDCTCVDRGKDGTRTCAPRPHKHRMRWPVAEVPGAVKLIMRACDNHLQNYLAKGWKEVATMACSRCCTNEPLAGDNICEACALALEPKGDATRLKETGYCINRDVIHGCLVWSTAGDNMCQHCRNIFNTQASKSASAEPKSPGRSRIRTVPSSARPCAITPGCAGTMQASVRRLNSENRPELWWTCAICSVSQLAERAKAVADPRTSAALSEQIEEAEIAEELKESINPELNDLAEAVRTNVRGLLAEGSE